METAEGQSSQVANTLRWVALHSHNTHNKHTHAYNSSLTNTHTYSYIKGIEAVGEPGLCVLTEKGHKRIQSKGREYVYLQKKCLL